MKINVLGSFVLIKLISLDDDVQIPDSLKEAGFEYKAGLDANAEFRAKSELTIGTVVGIGPYAWMMESLGYGTPNWKPWVQIGDKVMFSKYGGRIIKTPTGDEYYLCNDDDVQLKIED